MEAAKTIWEHDVYNKHCEQLQLQHSSPYLPFGRISDYYNHNESSEHIKHNNVLGLQPHKHCPTLSPLNPLYATPTKQADLRMSNFTAHYS